MTLAICLNCGGKKFGAFNVCPYCNYANSQENQLSLVLTDWCIHNDESFDIIGNMIREIHKHSNDPEIRDLVLIQYLFEEFPNIISGELSEDNLEIAKTILSKCTIPSPKSELSEEKNIEFQKNEELNNDIDELRQEYLNMSPYVFDIVINEDHLFTAKEKEDIAKYGNWFDAIWNGEIPLSTKKLKHFYEAQKDDYKGRTKYEELWYRYKKIEGLPF